MKLHQKLVAGFRPAVYARQGVMFGIRQPLDGPVFQKLKDAEHGCIHAMIDHYDRPPSRTEQDLRRMSAY